MSYTSHFYHIVFSTKDRRPFLDEACLPRIIDYLGGIIRNLKGQMLAGNGVPDHIHLAVIVHPTIAVSEFINKLKSNSSGWIHETFAELKAFGWQDGYSSFTVSRSILPKVIEYIRGQQAHHKTKTFEEELLALLKKHGIAYDERYVSA
ncbi:MAG: IS200/IS605 family transposase [Phycisphaerae bacterium]|jgi:REP element-mobilizing transposase RayT